ncbi:MAG: hypothetical protein ACTIDO_17770, partial [Brevibacterium aurantiacum]
YSNPADSGQSYTLIYDEPHNVPAQQPPQYAQPSGAAFEPAYPHQQGGTYAYGNGSGQVPGPEQNKQKRGKNVMGVIAFVVAVVGFIFACVPGALIVGWILLPIAFLLSIISFFLKGKKGFSIAALIISVVGTIVGILVFFFVVASSFDEAFSDDVSADTPAQEADSAVVEDGEDSAEEADGAAEEGTRENPYAIGTMSSPGFHRGCFSWFSMQPHSRPHLGWSIQLVTRTAADIRSPNAVVAGCTT